MKIYRETSSEEADSNAVVLEKANAEEVAVEEAVVEEAASSDEQWNSKSEIES